MLPTPRFISQTGNVDCSPELDDPTVGHIEKCLHEYKIGPETLHHRISNIRTSLSDGNRNEHITKWEKLYWNKIFMVSVSVMDGK